MYSDLHLIFGVINLDQLKWGSVMEYLRIKPDDADKVAEFLSSGTWDSTIQMYDMTDMLWLLLWGFLWALPFLFYFYLGGRLALRLYGGLITYPIIVVTGVFGYYPWVEQGIIPSFLYNLMGEPLFFTWQAIVYNYFTLNMLWL